MHSVVSYSTFIILVSFFSMAWFILGVLAGRRLPLFRTDRNGNGGPERSRGGKLIELYVGNLSYDISEKEMHKTFSQYGKVVSARIISNKFNGKSRGFGFVEMDDRSESDAAIRALNGKDIKGRKIVVNEAK